MPGARTKEVKFQGRPVWAEISLSALCENLRAIRKYVNPSGEHLPQPRKILAVVKGNAYGHGAAPVAKVLERGGADWFGVTCSSEGIELREAGIKKPILVMTGFWPGEEQRIVEHRLVTAITRCEQLRLLELAASRAQRSARRTARPVEFHLKIDSGMNRLGIAPGDVDCFAQQLARCKHLRLGGVFTHFASSGIFPPAAHGEQTAEQEKLFFASLARLRELGIAPGTVHLANSAAIAARPETWGDMVRPGAILYGYHSGFEPAERRAEFEARLPLRPAMSLRTRIIGLRNVAPGQGVGYDSRFTTARPSRIGVLAAGYGDGLHRSLGNRGNGLVHGKLAPIVGIVSMDVTMIDLTDVPEARLGDVVTIYGADGPSVLPANVVARGINTVTSDLLCAVSKRVPRFYSA
ncbi:MAG TPA: alanine racemase [Candidatus Acidoferrales bacterium]|nr:alanine racemase [Candidatus Acidoferrales bacterium]